MNGQGSLVIYAIMFLAGMGIPVMATLNAGLGTRLASPQSAALILFVVGLSVAVIVVAYSGLPSIKTLSAVPWPYYIGGVFVIFYILSMTWAAPKIGIGNAVFLVLLGQLVAAAVIDHYGILSALQTSISVKRVLGLMLILMGIYLARRPM